PAQENVARVSSRGRQTDPPLFARSPDFAPPGRCRLRGARVAQPSHPQGTFLACTRTRRKPRPMPNVSRISLGLVASLSLLVPACSDSRKTGAATGKASGYECAATMEGAAACAGQACLSLKANVQNKTGICTQRCTTTPDCTAGGTCVATSTLGSFCL